MTNEILTYLVAQNAILAQIWAGVNTRASVFLSIVMALIAGVIISPTDVFTPQYKIIVTVIAALPITASFRVLHMQDISPGPRVNPISNDIKKPSEDKEMVINHLTWVLAKDIGENEANLGRKIRRMKWSYLTTVGFMAGVIAAAAVLVNVAPSA